MSDGGDFEWAGDTSEDTNPASTAETPVLAIRNLEKHYPVTKGILQREVGRIRAVDGITFSIGHGEAMGLVGESGSGKSTTARTILRIEEPTGGEVRFDGDAVGDMTEGELQAFRRRVQLIVQDPNDAFSPRMKVGEAVAEPLRLHGMDDPDRRQALVKNLLERVGLSADDTDRYPHEFSGGEKQRIAIARALVVNPDLIVADEPTSALDGRVQADVLGLLDEIRREFDIAVLFISHDIDVVRRFCDRVAVMYLGELVEKGPIDDVLSTPGHPYTRVLLGSVPSLDPTDRILARPLTDTVPDPSDPPSGCRFHTRCPEVIPPTEMDIPGDLWDALATFRFTIEAGELPEEIDWRRNGGAVEPTDVREYFDLPESIDVTGVEGAVSSAVDAVARGEVDRAANTLADALPTPCERNTPDESRFNGRPVHCHRYDPSVAAEPQQWPYTPTENDKSE